MKMFKEFKAFALKGNLIDLAVGFTVGAAFTTVAKSLVNDIIMPPLGLVFSDVNFSNLYVTLRAGAGAADQSMSLEQAEAAGSVVLRYGLFLNNVLTFMLIALVMFAVVRAIARLNRTLEQEFAASKPELNEPDTKKCSFCLSTIAYRAVRCSFCTSDLKADQSAAN